MNALIRLIVLSLLILAFLLGLLSFFSKEEGEEKAIRIIQSKEPIIVVAAGDIACGPDSKDADCKEWETSEMIQKINPTAVLLLGDIQYEASQVEYFKGNDPFCQTKPPHCFGPTWGRFKNKTFPAAGNHEYSMMMGASEYFDYFNGVGNFSGSAGDRDKGYYSFNIGSWHLIALNSNCFAVGGCGIDSTQVKWLSDDLKEHKNKCSLAFWHHPRFSNGRDHGSDPAYDAFWKVLYEASTEIVLNGHSHYYERFMPINPYEYVDKDKGIRQFIVGTGGKNLTKISLPNSERRNNETFGVLKLTLYEDRYDWQFVPIEGQTFTPHQNGAGFTDSGTDYCH